jgi:predicted XRE-type DNA-binding protein
MKRVTVGSENVFRDLGLENPEELQAKAILAHYIIRAIDKRGLTQIQAAQIIGATQPNVSDLFRGRIDGFTIDRLAKYLNALGKDVEIKVRNGTGRTVVV